MGGCDDGRGGVDGTRDGDADCRDALRSVVGRDESACPGGNGVECADGAVGDGDVDAVGGEDPPGEIRERDGRVGGIDRRRDDRSVPGVEGEATGGAAPGHAIGALLDDQPELQQGVDAPGNRHAGQSRHFEDVSAGDGTALPDEIQHVAGTGHSESFLRDTSSL